MTFHGQMPDPHGEDFASDQRFQRIHQLVTATLERPDGPEVEELREMLSSGGPEVRSLYRTYMTETEALRASGLSPDEHGVPEGFASGATPHREKLRDVAGGGARPWGSSTLTLAASVLLLLSAGLMFRSAWPADSGVVGAAAARADGVATLTRVIAVEWEPGAQAIDEMSRVMPGQRLQISEGQIEIVFDTGVELVVAGHADAVVESANRVLGRLGVYSARVGERGKGFTIDTPTTRVVDLGTEFGVAIADSGDTEVAVFEGMVDLDALPERRSPTQPERLTKGEAVKIDALGNQTRLMAITSERFPTAGRIAGSGPEAHVPLITGVSDNLRDPANKKFYRLVRSGLYEDVSAFVDRAYEWNGIDDRGIPGFLRGAEYLMPFNDDKVQTGFELNVSLSGPCRLYVFYSNKMPIPGWLAEDFEDTGEDLGLDRQARSPSSRKRLAIGPGKSIDETFSIWVRDVDRAGFVTMGNAVQPLDGEKGWNMYSVAVTTLPPQEASAQRTRGLRGGDQTFATEALSAAR